MELLKVSRVNEAIRVYYEDLYYFSSDHIKINKISQTRVDVVLHTTCELDCYIKQNSNKNRMDAST